MRLFGGLDWWHSKVLLTEELLEAKSPHPLSLPIRGGRRSLFVILFAWDVNQFDRYSLTPPLTPPHFIGEGKTVLFSDW